MLGMELVSLGKNGAGQEYIFNSLVEYIIQLDDKDRIGLVIPAWSRSPRRDYQVESLWRNNKFTESGDLKYMITRSLRYYYQFQIFCERFNLPYKQIHMLDSLRFPINEIPDWYAYRAFLPSKNNKNVNQRMIDYTVDQSPFYHKLNEEKFMGWPLIRALGGYALDQHVICVSKEKYRI